MKENEAQDILRMVRGATTQFPVDDDTITFWLHSLKPLDAEAATKAVILGARTWDRFPAWASFFEAYRAAQRARDVQERGQKDIVVGRRGFATPEWVWVWMWARTIRDPREDRGFPQQDMWTDPERTMTNSDYQELRKEWVDLGSPKGKMPILGRAA